MKVIRALKNIHVPSNPEEKGSKYIEVRKGLIALVPDNFNIANKPGSFEEIHSFEEIKKVQKRGRPKKEKEEKTLTEEI